ncbi:HlyC/CorC family transporter [Corynebacterium sp. 320]|uniref:hemolysin family protein n=1 Tax=Corynebacterium TaxID=1716 RepID=UPI00125CB187|nr:MULTISPECIES: hemolysin family protein [Corynebacterium]KAB1503606.1 HlyC/CorC family transporter [Corynebacterium sp. 320]KAB1553293.1 HlyC/CorC family transporter [Corynebacterium sp. 321]KAB1553488.1 HlyC/CorC family transporter [Corynebacterium sp. 319]KAB3527742.1 HlyC/CorC family transporter [Corynebacterium sp. 250]KAB3540768.1 HlyC/CorC family transporter [Corynebacterium sp. 366]
MDIVLSIVGLLGFVALTAATGLFVAIEFALTGLERSTVDEHVKEKNDATARLVRRAHGNLSFVLSGAQLGITVTTLATGYLAEPILAQFFTPVLEAIGLPENSSMAIALILSLIIATFLSMVFGELVPKNLAIAKPLTAARTTVLAVWTFNKCLKWFINALNSTANAIVRKLGIEPADELASARSPAELSALVRNSTGAGGFSLSKATVLEKSLRFGEATAEDIMTPRSTVETLQAEHTALDLIQMARESGHSRFPVVRGDLDETIGVVHIKDALTVPAERRAMTMVKDLCRPVPTVPDSLGGDAVLNHVRRAGSQLVLVADEYGGTSGIVTIEDVVEEIVGEVWDEHDNKEEDAEVRKAGQSWEISGLVRVDELSDAVGYHAPEGPYETLGGLIMSTLGRIPSVGDSVLLPQNDREFMDGFESGLPNRWVAEVQDMDNRRVDRARVRPLSEQELRELNLDDGKEDRGE